jgi:hypothetical protein
MLLGLIIIDKGLILIVFIQHEINNYTIKFLWEVLLFIDDDLLGEAGFQKIELVPAKYSFTEDEIDLHLFAKAINLIL